MQSATLGIATTATANRHVRSRYWILPRLQARFMGWLVAISTVVAGTVAWSVMLVVWSPLSARLVHSSASGDIDQLFWDVSVRVMLTTALLIGIFSLVALLSGLIMSHKVAGPLYRIGVVASQVAHGNYRSRIEIRRGDYIHDLALDVNHMLDHVESRIRQQQRALTTVYGRLSDLERIISDGTVEPEQIEKQLRDAVCAIREAHMAELAEDTAYT